MTCGLVWEAKMKPHKPTRCRAIAPNCCKKERDEAERKFRRDGKDIIRRELDSLDWSLRS